MSMDVLVEALDNDAGYRSHLFSRFANKKTKSLSKGLVVKVNITLVWNWEPTFSTNLKFYPVMTHASTVADLYGLEKTVGVDWEKTTQTKTWDNLNQFTIH